ncbi:MAG: 50S ribosomal protein L22 [Candidatus Saganbacteria bacterium]|nr:50S ribosomal protein L22 [Candidatus Saganbacteria bacterium]
MTKVTAKVKWVRIGPRKLARLVDLVRGKQALAAVTMLRFMPQKGARVLEKAIRSALANAKNNFKLEEESLIVSEAYVNKAVTMRRWQPRARGRIFPINKRTSHLTVCLGQPKAVQAEPKEAPAKAKAPAKRTTRKKKSAKEAKA